MQNKGIIKFIAIALTLVCIFYLSFSVVTKYHEGKASKMEAKDGEAYLDSVMNEKIWLGLYTYKQCREMEIGLGLDLKGGMNVILEISVPDVIDELADHKTDEAYRKSFNEAKQEEAKSQEDFFTLFMKRYKENAPGHRLAEIFATQKMKGKVSTQSTDAEVERAVRSEVNSAVDNSFNVVRNRIDKFGVVQPNIQKLEGHSGRIMVEMPGIKEPERMRKLLQGSAKLEFWETYNSQEIYPYLSQLNQRFATLSDEDSSQEDSEITQEESQIAITDTLKADTATDVLTDVFGANTESDETNEQDYKLFKRQNPLFAILQPTQQGLSVVGYANARDTAEVNTMIYSDIAKQVLPTDLKLLWGVKAMKTGDNKAQIFELYAIKVTDPQGNAPLEGDVIVNAKDGFDQYNNACVTMEMNTDGARSWAQLTKMNIGKAVAIVLDDAVYSAPRVNSEITGGNSQITGDFTIEETKDLANTLNSGKMPAPTRIVQEEVVGPSLGAQSIKQGFISFIVAFLLLMIYMVLLYNWIPGMLTNCALLCNLFFTLGILASLQAALTMPGIAGIVLALGMAVDANVLIYERVKEEMRAGLNLREAMHKGHANAFSAIFDSNLTSILTGIILYSFGTGPIRGFATTLIIGICCSFFTAVYLTRIVYLHQMKHDRWLNLTFSTSFSRSLFKNPSYNFMGLRKKAFSIWGILALVFIICLSIRGLSRSIDFTGGRNYVIKLETNVEPEDVREALAGAFGDANLSVVATQSVLEGQCIRISTNYKIDSNDNTIDDEVEEILFTSLKASGLVTQENVNAFKNPDVREGGSIISSSKVGPSVASDITRGAIVSVIIAIVVIFLYILLRFRNVAYSIGSTIALALDTLVVLGFYSLLWGVVPMSLEIDQTFIGAVLTVIGYSINDKVVVFDRVRENFHLFSKRDHLTLFNTSLNQTLSRTINTSLSTLLVLLCIFFFGGDSIRSFSFAMILGVVFGTLSSIFIAAPIAFMLMGKATAKQTDAKKN